MNSRQGLKQEKQLQINFMSSPKGKEADVAEGRGARFTFLEGLSDTSQIILTQEVFYRVYNNLK